MKKTLYTSFLAVLIVALSGCLASREISEMQRLIQHSMPEAEFQRIAVASVGPFLMGSVRMMTRLSDDEDAQIAADLLRDVRRIKAGVYEVKYLPNGLKARFPRKLEESFEAEGWVTAVRVRTEDENVSVMYKERRGDVKDLFVTVLTEDELVLARMKGNLSRILRRALDEYGDEIYGPVREEFGEIAQ